MRLRLPFSLIFKPFANIATLGFVCFGLLLGTACESHDRTSDDAFEQVKESKATGVDTPVTTQEFVPDPKKKENVAPKLAPVLSEQARYEQEIEKKITANEERIKLAKSVPLNPKSYKVVAGLEEDNAALRARIQEFNADAKQKWEAFKAEMDKDANQIAIALETVTAKGAGKPTEK